MKKLFLSFTAILMACVYSVSAVAQVAPQRAAASENAEVTLTKVTGDEGIYHYYLPQGVAVDRNPSSPYYGYTYVAESTDGASDGVSDITKTQKRGIFVYDAELNSLNPDNVGFLPANAAALMTDVSRQAMHRVAVNPVNNHVAFCYNVEGASAIWSMDPANLAGEAVNLIEGLAITKANAFCFDAEGTLYVMDNANTDNGGGKLVKVVDGELVLIAQNATWGVQDNSLASDGRGGLWVAQNRWAVDDYAVLSHVNADGIVDLAVTGDSEYKNLFPNDANNASYRGQCAYNVEKDILAFGGNKVVALFQVTYDELGVPALDKVATTEAIGNNIDGVDFYPNGDLAVVSASVERFVKYAVTYPSEEEPENPEEPEIEWMEMSLEIANLTTEVMEVEDKQYLQLNGRDDMNDADVMLFLNDYTGEDKEYEVNAESSYMTFGGIELTVLDGVMTQAGETYAGVVHTYAAEEGMYVELALTMSAATATTLVLTDAIVAVNEELGTLTFNVPTEEGGYFVELSGYTAPGVHEGPQICLFETPETVAYANYVETVVEGGVITLTGEFTSFMGAKFDLTISGQLTTEPEDPEVGLPAANVRAWAYDLALAVEGEQYTFSFKATTAALATLILTDVEGTELATIDLGLAEAGDNVAVLAASELPAGQTLNWSVKLEAGAIAEVVVLTDASDKYYYYLAQDIEVNTNPESEYFGTIYVAEPYAGASDGASEHSKTQSIGIYAYDVELNLANYAQGYVPSNVTVNAADKHNTLHRLAIHPLTDEVVFTQSVGAYVWAANPADLTAEATNLAEGTGIAKTNSVCFDENGVMYVFDASTDGGGTLYKVEDGVATAVVSIPAVVNDRNSLAADGHGGVWIGQNRSQMDAYNYLTHVNAAGEIDYEVNVNSAEEVKAMFAANMNRGHIAYDAQRDVLAIGGGGKVTLLNATYDENGAPTLTKWTETPMFNAEKPAWNVDGIAFDYAGDLYVVCASNERFYKYALPTDNNVCTTPAASKYAFQVEGGEIPEPELYEDEITNMTFDLENMVIIGGPSENFQIDVYLVLGEDDGSGEFQLTEESSVAVMGSDAKFIAGIAYEIDAYAPAALVDLVVEWNGTIYQFHLTMSAAPMEATVVVVENAAIEVQKNHLFGDTYDYSLKMTGVWYDAEGLNYPVLVEVPVYYPESTEPYEMMSTVTVGGWADDENWLGFGEGYLTITTVGNVVTATGIVENPMANVAIDITISGELKGEGTGLENATVTVKAVKTIKNGQLIITRDGKEYNAQGAILK